MNLDEFLAKFPPPGRVLFAKVWGSRSHNTEKPDSDTDFAGVYVCRTRDILSLSPPPDSMKYDHEEAGGKEDRPDHQFHEVGRFCELLLKGNPGIVEELFTDRMCTYTDEWRGLRAVRDRFLSRQVVKQYLGYMQGQLRRLEAHDGKKGLHAAGGSYNEKWAYHILRLAADAQRIARGLPPQVWKEGPERAFLMRVRSNAYTWDTVRDMIREAVNGVDALKPWDLPEEGDKAALNDWLLAVRRENW